MAKLYRPKVVSYRLPPDGAYRTPEGHRVTKTTPGAVKTVTTSKKWYGRYTDGAGRPIRTPLSTSKDIARRMLAKFAGDAQLSGVGLSDPFAEQRSRPLLDHLEDYRRYLVAKSNTGQHVAKTCSRIRAVIEGCSFKAPDQIQASAVVEFLGNLRLARSVPPQLDPRRERYTRYELAELLQVNPDGVARLLRRVGLSGEGKGKARRYPAAVVAVLAEDLFRGRGVTTCNHYLTATKGFTRWLVRDRRLAADPLAHLSRQNPDVDVRHPRRALREEQFDRFIEATAAGVPFRGLTGADRLVLYTLAGNTGFRAGELASLTPASFELDVDQPTTTVEAAYSKHRRKDVQPLRADVAEMMRSYLAGRPARQPIWPGTWKQAAAEMLRKDLATAGVPYRDQEGRYFDFHAMRGQFISLLAARGVHPKVAQTLARHSTVSLTMDYYTHLDVLDLPGALEKLPGLPPAGQGAATAPHPKPARGRPAARRCQRLARAEGTSGHFKGKVSHVG